MARENVGFVGVFLACGLAGCGASPCVWDTSETFRDREAVIATEPTVTLECAGEPVPVAQELGAFYGGSIGRSAPDDPGDLFVRIQSARVSAELHFAGNLPDGSYLLEASFARPATTLEVWPSSGLVSGSFAFARTRNVPFVDIREPEERTYESSIEVEFDLAITDLTNTPANMPELGCRLVTGRQQAHLTQRGPATTCQRSLGGH